jgi:hypothetical protein
METLARMITEIRHCLIGLLEDKRNGSSDMTISKGLESQRFEKPIKTRHPRLVDS